VDSVPSSSKELPDIPEWTPPKRTQNEENERRMAADQKAYRGLGVGLTIAYTIIGLPLVGLAIGWALDTAATGGNLFRALGCVAGMTLGVFMAIRMMNANESRM
jgi:F0F1-type ATP synthase assembly protein I